jgi:hypothetical protein
MSKATVTKIFIGGGLAIFAGAILAIAAIWIAIANNVFVMNGPDIVALRGSPLGWSALGFALVGGLAMAAGAIGGVVAWIGALLNTVQHDNKTWFVALLLLGIFSLGFIAMIAFVLAGPDASRGTGGRAVTTPVAAA